MKRLIALFIILLGTDYALAQEEENAGEPVPPAACNLLAQYEPTSYGITASELDTDVVPADLNNRFAISDMITIPLTVDVWQRLKGEDADIEGVEMDKQLGMISVHMDGRITYDGEDWTRRMFDFCNDPAQWPDRQEQMNAIKSSVSINEKPIVNEGSEAQNSESRSVETKPPEPQASESEGEVLQGGEGRDEAYE